MTQQELNNLLDEVSIAFYEAGANYDSDYESWSEKYIANIEATYQVTIIEP